MTRRRVAKRSVRSLRTRGGLQIRLSDDKNQPEIKVDVNAVVAKFAGVVQCDTLVANSVVAASYVPGAGNIW
jgi:hypothetical protein